MKTGICLLPKAVLKIDQLLLEYFFFKWTAIRGTFRSFTLFTCFFLAFHPVQGRSYELRSYAHTKAHHQLFFTGNAIQRIFIFIVSLERQSLVTYLVIAAAHEQFHTSFRHTSSGLDGERLESHEYLTQPIHRLHGGFSLV